jgi:hypothetical protein
MIRSANMNVVEQAAQTQLGNIQKKTGKTLDELAALARQSGAAKHGEVREMFIKTLDLGYGDANALAHYVLQPEGGRAAEVKNGGSAGILDEIYSGPKTGLRPIHDKLVDEIGRLGEFEVAPKKGYVSLRRKKQFAMLGPANNTRLEVGINARDLAKNERLVEQAPGGMCNYKVRLSSVDEVDAELIAWIHDAYENAG